MAIRRSRRRPTSRLRLLLASIGVVASGGIGAWYVWTGTVYYSLQQLRRAITHHDRYLFEHHVDLDLLTRRLIDDYLAVSVEEIKQQPMGALEQLGVDLGLTVVQLIKPRLAEEARYAVMRGVESGSLERGDVGLDSPTSQDQVGEAVAKAAEDFPKFKPLGLGKIHPHGGTATVDVDVQLLDDAPVGDIPRQTLSIRFVRTPERRWRATEVENFRQVLRMLQEREKKRLEVANQTIRKTIGESLAVVSVTKDKGINSVDNANDAWVVATLRNTSMRTIRGFVAEVTIGDLNGGELKTLQIQDNDPIPPTETRKRVWSMALDLSDELDRFIYNADASEVTVTMTISHLVFQDGTSIKLAESLEELSAVTSRPPPKPPATSSSPAPPTEAL